MTSIVTRPIDADLAQRYRADGQWDTGGLRSGVEHFATTTPDRVALIDSEQRWTYAELGSLVDLAVTHVADAGVSQGSQVLIIAPVTALAVVAYLATIRLGATAVLLDRRSGRSDVRHLTGPLDIELVLADPDAVDALGLDELDLPVLPLAALLEPVEQIHVWDEPSLDAPAAVFVTSGTTSRPKSVVHSINTLRSGSREMADATEFGPSDVAFLSSPLASITGIIQVHLTLERGAGLALENHFDPANSLRHVVDLGITVIGGAPIIMDILFNQAVAQGLDELPLRAISLGGGAIPRDLVELGLQRWGIQPVRVYGSSEAPLATHTLPTDQGERRIADDGALGAGVEIQLDESVGGEILVRGPMRFLGYVHEEDNAAAFVEGGWYRTGDLGRIEDGRLWVTGRLKEIVARKGLKISMNEIDQIARTLPGIEEAVSYGVPDAETVERLVLAVSGPAAGDLTLQSVTEHFMAAGIAKWKLPEEIVVWDTSLPRTASGKVQRRLLPGGGSRHLLAPRLSAAGQS